jgi:2-polyprenyl-6-methoxyphenol hydroxylase-like FAD-dependent oxidoreductase
LGLGDAAALAQTLAFARKVGQDVGDVGLLQARYESQQQRVNLGMMTALEVLWRGFGVQQGLVGAVRSAGLGALNSLGPLKNGIMKYAMGLSSNLP